MRLLVAGWFSFDQMGASAGDLLAKDLVCRWLIEAGYNYDLALAPPFEGGIPWQKAKPSNYIGTIFVCGPFGNGPPLTEFLSRFSALPLIGINLSMLDDLGQWNPFQLLIERDSSRSSRPDLVFLTEQSQVPVVGLILVHHQHEYGNRAMHSVVEKALKELIATREMALVPIDTRLDENDTGLRTAAEVESLITRMDIVITTRLHGMVMALKNGVPALVVDPIAGGEKITRQANEIGWDVFYKADEFDDKKLEKGLDFCLSPAGRSRAEQVSQNARSSLAKIKDEFLHGLSGLNCR